MKEKNNGDPIPSRSLLSIFRVSETSLGRKKGCAHNPFKNVPITNFWFDNFINKSGLFFEFLFGLFLFSVENTLWHNLKNTKWPTSNTLAAFSNDSLVDKLHWSVSCSIIIGWWLYRSQFVHLGRNIFKTIIFFVIFCKQ